MKNLPSIQSGPRLARNLDSCHLAFSYELAQLVQEMVNTYIGHHDFRILCRMFQKEVFVICCGYMHPPPPTDTVDADSVRRFSEWLNSNRNADVSSVFHEIVAYSKAPQPQQWASVSVPVVVCVTCNGSGIVDDGEIDCYENGEPYEHGPVKCVKDCPDCTTLPTKNDNYLQ